MDLYEIERWNGDMKSKGKTWLRISRKGTYAMKKFTVAVLIIGAFILYSLLYAMQTLSRSYQITRRIQAHPAEVPLPVLYRLHPVRQTHPAHPVLFIKMAHIREVWQMRNGAIYRSKLSSRMAK